MLNQPKLRRRLDSRRRRQLRLRIVARACRLGAARCRLPRRHRAVVRRHLPQQRDRQRHAAGGAAGSGRRDDSVMRTEQDDSYALEVDLERGQVGDRFGLNEPFTIDSASRQRLLEGKDEIDVILQHEADIAASSSGRRGISNSYETERRTHHLVCLVEQGVDTVFGYPGGAILPAYDASARPPDSPRAGPARTGRHAHGRRLCARQRQGRRRGRRRRGPARPTWSPASRRR